MSAPGATTPAVPSGQQPTAAENLAQRLAAASAALGEPTTPQQVLGGGEPAQQAFAPQPNQGQVPEPQQQQGQVPAAPAQQTQQGQGNPEPQQQQQTSPEDGWLAQQPEEVQTYVRRLRSEAASHRTRAQTAEQQAEELRRAQMTEAQRAAHDQQQSSQELGNLRRQVAAMTAGLPAEMAARLQGDSLEQLVQDAETLRQQFGLPAPTPGAPPQVGQQQVVRPDFGAGARPPAGPGGENVDFNSTLRQAAGRPA